MKDLLSAAKKVQTWIHAHPRKATIVRSVIDEFDKVISDAEEKKTIMEIENIVKQNLLSRGFTEKQLLNNRGLIGATVDEVVKLLATPAVSESVEPVYL